MSDTSIDYKTIPVLSKYFADGRIEEWLTDDEGSELYLIRSYQHPSGQSPIVKMKDYIETPKPFSNTGRTE